MITPHTTIKEPLYNHKRTIIVACTNVKVKLILIPWLQEEDDFTIRRFLRARDLDLEKASTMFLKYLKWKHSFVPNGVSVSDVPNEVAQDKAFIQGHDKIGRPILIVFGKKHFQNKHGGLDEFKRTFHSN